jgi:hypothetical protein
MHILNSYVITGIVSQDWGRFCYVAYNLCLFDSFNNYSLWSIIVVITLEKCAQRTPAGVRERHTCIGLIQSINFYMIYNNILNLGSAEHVWVEYHVAESFGTADDGFARQIKNQISSGSPYFFFLNVFLFSFSYRKWWKNMLAPRLSITNYFVIEGANVLY